MRAKKHHMIVCVGDTIKAVFSHHRPESVVIGVVKEITERIGHEPLIEVEPISDTRPPFNLTPDHVHNSFSVFFVTEIINRPKPKGRPVQKPLPNAFVINPVTFSTAKEKGIRSGYLTYLVKQAMKGAKIEVIDIDMKKCYTLWNKQKPGFLKKHSFDPDYIYVHWKPFKKWVLRNQTKLTWGRKQIVKEVRIRDKKASDDYWKFVDDMNENEINDFLFPETNGETQNEDVFFGF